MKTHWPELAQLENEASGAPLATDPFYNLEQITSGLHSRARRARREASISTHMLGEENDDEGRTIGNDDEEQEEEEGMLLAWVAVLLVQRVCYLAAFILVEEVFAFRWHLNSGWATVVPLPLAIGRAGLRCSK